MLAFLQHLPKNSTSVCQPLDVGVMGPFTKLKELWMLERPPPLKNGEKGPRGLPSKSAWKPSSER
ncbi:hypothetical protein JG687_00005571 [Phytophthora cactorum]|uniref:DDE-1 domain-containing protein n=1 Tax=Phytophthora cactorum TaxID=29920 RepID=A0A8T1UQ99_9STRA|nr:hypothetical protein JG687_00005571 [Phytophthora cactorum]